MRNFFHKIKNSRLELFFIFAIPLIPTAFLLKEGFFLHGDGIFPVDLSSLNLFEHSFFKWTETGFGADTFFSSFRPSLVELVLFAFRFNLEFAQFFYYYLIFFIGAVGMFRFSGYYLKAKLYRIMATVFYTINVWIVLHYTHFTLLQGFFSIPLLLYFYAKYIEEKRFKYLFLHTIFLPLLAVVHAFAIYIAILFIYNFVYLVVKRKKYFNILKYNILLAIISILILSYFFIPFFSTLSDSNTLTSSVETFSKHQAYKVNSPDQTIFNSMRLISVGKLYRFLSGSSDSIYGTLLSFLSIFFILLSSVYFLFIKKIDRQKVFLITLYIGGIFISSFHKISNDFIARIITHVFPPVSTDSSNAIPLVILSTSIMIPTVFKYLFEITQFKKLKFLCISFVFVYIFFISYPLYDNDSFDQIRFDEINKNSLYIRDKIQRRDDSYILIYPIGTIHNFFYTKYPIHYNILFPFKKVVSFLPWESTYLPTRNLLNRFMYPNNESFSPDILRQIGISQIVIMKRVENQNVDIYLRMRKKLRLSGFMNSYEDKNFLIYKAKKYLPIVYSTRNAMDVLGDTEELNLIAKAKSLEEK